MAAAAPLDIHAVAKQFTEYYYGVFDSNRAGLLPLYRDYSMMTYESKQVSGAQQIVQYLVERPFQAIQHVITTVDVQPSHPSQGSILITVMGQLKVDDNPPMGFMQVFNLYPEGPGQYFVYNDVFRLILH
ncbi:nuclear transport factor 2 [Zopfochytrium polystomum]|nr:nuclear transport factor 2 [Zopfochytrium polystomum]